MNTTAFTKAKKQLEKEKKQLESSLLRIATKDKHLKDDYDAKYEDLGSEIFDQSMEATEVSEYDRKLSLEANLEVQLREVNRGLERIAKNTFGKCSKCNREIEEKRLLANPTAKTCVGCVRKQEE